MSGGPNCRFGSQAPIESIEYSEFPFRRQCCRSSAICFRMSQMLAISQSRQCTPRFDIGIKQLLALLLSSISPTSAHTLGAIERILLETENFDCHFRNHAIILGFGFIERCKYSTEQVTNQWILPHFRGQQRQQSEQYRASALRNKSP